MYGDHHDPCDQKDLRRVKHIDGAFYWGPRVKEARGRWVKVCKWCIEEMGQESEGTEKEMKATFF